MSKYVCDNSTYEEKLKELLSPEWINAVWNIDKNEISFVTQKYELSEEFISVDQKTSYLRDFITNGNLDKTKMKMLKPIYVSDLKICVDLANNRGFTPALKKLN
jgi:hypothetical protein